MTKDEELEYAFRQRDELLTLVAHEWGAVLMLRKDDDPSDADWPMILCIELHTGKLYYHIHKSRLHMFKHCGVVPNDWDGSDPDERTRRIAEETLW